MEANYFDENLEGNEETDDDEEVEFNLGEEDTNGVGRIIGTNYEEARSGSGRSTKAGKSSANVPFTAFLNSLPLTNTTLGNWDEFGEEHLCSESHFRQYGTYLTTTALSKKGKLFKQWSALQYFSAAHVQVKTKYSTNKLFAADSEWYRDVRASMIGQISQRHIRLCEPIKDKCSPLSRVLLSQGIEKSMRGVSTVRGYEDRHALLSSFKGGARGGECGLFSYKLFSYNHVHGITDMLWQESKGKKQKPLVHVPDTVMELCWFHSSFCYIAVGGGGRHTTSSTYDVKLRLVLPFLQRYGADKVSTILLDMAADNPSWPTDVTSKSLRSGMTMEVRRNRTAGMEAANALGGWLNDGCSISRMFDYLSDDPEMMRIGATAISGWTHIIYTYSVLYYTHTLYIHYTRTLYTTCN
jgi:hypothetical protein